MLVRAGSLIQQLLTYVIWRRWTTPCDPEVYSWETEAIFRRLEKLPRWEEAWPVPSSSLSAMLLKVRFSVKRLERLAFEWCPARRAAFGRLYL